MLLAWGVAAGEAEASILLGETVGYQYLFPDQSTVLYQAPDFVVGAGVELPALYFPPIDVATLDVSDQNILLDFYAAGTNGVTAFSGFRLHDALGAIPAFTTVTLNAATNMAGLTNARVTFDADNIYVNLQGLSYNELTIVSIDVGSNEVGAVPLPGGLAIWGGIAASVGAAGAGRGACRRARG
jgi:hypothetical protein